MNWEELKLKVEMLDLHSNRAEITACLQLLVEWIDENVWRVPQNNDKGDKMTCEHSHLEEVKSGKLSHLSYGIYKCLDCGFIGSTAQLNQSSLGGASDER